MTEASDGGTAARLALVREQMADAAGRVGRDPAELTLIVVTKFQPAELVRDLVELGITDVGENRAQEAAAKAADVADSRVRWHFIGQLQRNKAKLVRSFAASVHSLDSAASASALGSVDSTLDCFVQLNLTDDPGRGGVKPAELLPLAEHVSGVRGLRLVGVMAVAPLGEEPRRAFARVREASESLRTLVPTATAISAGMSGDFAEAIAEGATHLRIGTAITGKRPSRA